MKNQRKNIIIITFITLITVISSFSVQVLAQESLPLVVMPARSEIEVDPGEKTAFTVNFYNQSGEPVSGFFRTADFVVEDNRGTVKLIENTEDAPVKYAASNWVTLPYDRATLPANDKVTLQAEMQVPQDAYAGGRYVAVFFQQSAELAESTENEAGSGTNLRLASLIYIKVKGEITEKALVSRFFAPSFQEYGPVEVAVDILNRGDYHVKPNASLTLSNMFGGLVDQKLLKSANIFPDSSRNYVDNLGGKWMIGRYKLTLTGSYGQSGQALTSAAYVWIFPWRVALAILLAIIIIYMAMSGLVRNRANSELDLKKELDEEKAEIEKLKEALRKKKE